MAGEYLNNDGSVSAGIVVERGSLGFNAFTVIRRATIQLQVGPTATAAPVRLPAVPGAAIAILELPFGDPASTVYWSLDAAGAAAPATPAAYSTSGTGGTPGDRPLTGRGQVVTLTAAQQALLAQGNLYLSAVGSTTTIQLTFGNNL